MTVSVGIRGFGCYVPRSRLSRAAIAAAWGREGGEGGEGGEGERAVARYDEDALTLAVEAGAQALSGLEARAIGAFFLATTTSPFGEKAAADVVAAALDLRPEVHTAEFGGSTRAFTAAVRAACDAVVAGSCRNALVVAADVRTAPPGSALEALLGDGAAAVVIGRDGVIAALEETVSSSDPYAPAWRGATERLVRTDDEKVAAEAYVAGSLQLAQRLLEVAAREPSDVTRVVAYAPSAGAYRALLRGSGMGERFLARPLAAEVGDTGAANVALQLCAALEEARAGERLLLLNWAGGGDALLWRCTRRSEGSGGGGRPLAHWLAARSDMGYQDYLRYRDLIATRDGLWALDPAASLTAGRRDAAEILRLHGRRCGACGAILYPVRPACRACGASGPFDDVALGRRGTLVTWNRDHVYPGPGAPVVNAVIDLEGGGRVLTQLSEGIPEVGLAVELTLRKLHEGRGMPHYWWKAREAAK